VKVYEVYIIKESGINNYTPRLIRENMLVKVNDEIKASMVDYIVENSSVRFFQELSPSDKITIENDVFDLPKVVSKNPYARNSMFTLFSSDVKFKFNHKYELNIVANQDYLATFSTKYDPYYSTVDRVRKDTGDLLDLVSDEVIANIIYDNSKDVNDKLGDDTSVFDDGTPMYIKNYVRYKTDLDLCNAVYLSKIGKVGAFKKKLGDLEVSNEVKVPQLKDMLSRFKELLRYSEDTLNGETTESTVAFVKASQSAYPVANRGVF
jgi:hypothetical protein